MYIKLKLKVGEKGMLLKCFKSTDVVVVSLVYISDHPILST